MLYFTGQLYEIAEDIFSLKLKVSIMKESMEGNYYVAVLRLEFDNSDYVSTFYLSICILVLILSIHKNGSI